MMRKFIKKWFDNYSLSLAEFEIDEKFFKENNFENINN